MSFFDGCYLAVASLIALFQAFVMPILGVGGSQNYNPLPLYDKIRKFIEQLLSTVIGFALLFYLIKKGIYAIAFQQYNLVSITDVFLLVLGLFGIAGFLSYATFTAATNITKLFGK